MRRVAGGGNENDPGLAQIVDGIMQRLGCETGGTPTGIDDSRAFAARVIHAPDGVGNETIARGVQKFARHDLHLPGHSHHPDAVVAQRADSAADVRAVAVIVHGIAAVGDGVDAVNIIHKTVAIIINPVAGNFARIHPHVVRQVLVRIAHAGVNDRHDDGARRVLNIPSVGSVDVRAGDTSQLTGIVQSPERTVSVTKIIRRQQSTHLEIGLGVFDQGVVFVSADEIRYAARRRHLQHLQLPEGRILL